MKKLIFIFSLIFVVNVNAQWIQLNNPGGYLMSMASSGTYLFAGTYNYPNGAVYVSTNNGTNWAQTPLNNKPIYSMLISGINIFAGVYGGVYLSTNNGTTWTPMINGFTNENIGTLAISGANIFAGAFDYPYNGVFLSTNNGLSWTQVNSGLPPYSVHALAAIGTNIFAGTQYNGVFLSTNNGTNWNPVNNGLTGLKIKSFAVIGNMLFAGSFIQSTGGGNGVFLTTNNGSNWIAVNNGIEGFKVNSLSVSGTNILAATDNSVIMSTNFGTSWQTISDGLNSSNTFLIFCTQYYAYTTTTTTLNSNLWRRPLSEILHIQIKNNVIPSGFLLSQNYPNPFNPETKIVFSIPSKEGYGFSRGVGLVTLKVFDITGREVQTLVNENLQPGTYEVTLDGSKLTSGVYFYRLQAGDYSASEKMLLIK